MPTQPAILRMARINNVRLGYESAALAAIRRTRVRILLAGADVRVRIAGLTIRDILNDTPNTAGLTITSPAPTTGQALRITINSDTPRLLFNGTIQTDDLTYEGKATQLAYPCAGIDDTARANQRRPFGTWTLISATTIAQYLVTTYAPGFTSVNVQASLATVTITFDGSEDFSTCLARLATMIGGYYYWEDGDLHLFTAEATDTPDPIQTGYAFADTPPITVSTDDSQLMTRVYGKGHGEAVPCDVLAAESIVPLADAVLFNVLGGEAMAGTTPDGAQSQKLAYTGIHLGGVGVIVGPGATPSAAPALAPAAGAGLGLGLYVYAYTDVTASGESLPSPLGSITTTDAVTPPGALTANTPTAGFPLADVGNHDYVVTFLTAAGETLPGTASNSVTTTPTNQVIPLTGIPIGPAGVIGRRIYRRFNGAGTYKLEKTINDNTQTITGSGLPNASLGAAAPVADTTAARRVAVSAIAAGASPTTSRKVYRTVVAGSQLKLLTTLADNTTTTYADSTADGSLGANVPTSDTSLLTQPSGQVNAGSTTLLTAGTGALPSSGWVVTSAGDVVRYTGISTNTLTGVPASGAGAILTTVPYNQQLVGAPALTGVTGTTLAMQKGSPVHIWVQRDDLTAQANAAARESTATYTSTGIHEFLIVDERRGEASLIARCDAELALYADPIVTVTYATRDVKTKSGKTIVVNLASPAISQTLVIQEVTISEIDIAPHTAPKFLVKASTVRFSLEDILRRITL